MRLDSWTWPHNGKCFGEMLTNALWAFVTKLFKKNFMEKDKNKIK